MNICERPGNRVRQSCILTGRFGRVRRSGIVTAVAVLLVFFGGVRAQDTAGSKALHVTLPRIEANRNLSPAGQLQDGVLTVHLEIREGDWYPDAETGPTVVVQAFAEEGSFPPSVSARQVGQELQQRMIERVGLVPVGEVPGRGEQDEARVLDLLLHHPHGLKRRVLVTADQERRRLDLG